MTPADPSLLAQLRQLRDRVAEYHLRQMSRHEIAMALDAILEAQPHETPLDGTTPSDDPNRSGDGRLLLNTYGRRCYLAGKEAASQPPETAQTPLRECVHGHKKRQVGCVSCVILFAAPTPDPPAETSTPTNDPQKMREEAARIAALPDWTKPRLTKENMQPPADTPTGLAPLLDAVCEHGTAMDVHCCNCHSGFLFDVQTCVCTFESPGPDFVELLNASKAHVRASVLWKRFIEHTPLENDIVVWMADFAIDAQRQASASVRREAIEDVEKWLVVMDLMPAVRAETRKPTHGTCCTCQTCGHNYDDCVCDRNAVFDAWRVFRDEPRVSPRPPSGGTR